MTGESPEKLEIFLLLALRQPAGVTEGAEIDSEKTPFPALAAQLSAPEIEKFERLRADYQNKSEREREKWRGNVESLIGADEPFLDDNIHRSHIDEALQKENPAVRETMAAFLPSLRDNSGEKASEQSLSAFQPNEWLVKRVRRAFARQFVALRDLTAVTDFDCLSGAQFARLVRLAGVGEVALACVRIPAVESVAAFLRRFPPEDARAIAARLKSLAPASDERLSFAENLVQSALEIEPNPAAMLDFLGIRLVGAALCGAAPERLTYTEQKLPPEASRKFAEIVETECRRTPPEMQTEIAAEIERLAETITQTNVKA